MASTCPTKAWWASSSSRARPRASPTAPTKPAKAATRSWRSARPNTPSSPGTTDRRVPTPDAPSGPLPAEPQRQVWCEDALGWLERQRPLASCSVITSLPDVSGMPSLGLDGWRSWFIDAAELVLEATPDDGVTIFYQTDIKVDGTWVDKSYLCHRAAERANAPLLWHRIVCRKPAGESNFGRPAYSHLLCYSRAVRDRA